MNDRLSYSSGYQRYQYRAGTQTDTVGPGWGRSHIGTSFLHETVLLVKMVNQTHEVRSLSWHAPLVLLL